MQTPVGLRLAIHGIMAAISIFYFLQVRKLSADSHSLLQSFWNQHVFLTNLTHTLITIYYLWTFQQDIQALLSPKPTSKATPATQQSPIHEYRQSTHTYFQLILSMSMIVGVGYWSIVLYDPSLLFGVIDPDKVNFYYMMYYLHGSNHLILYLEIFLYRQHVFVSHKEKSIINAFVMGFYFLITAIHYFYFGKVVYAFQNEGLAVMLPIYAISLMAYVIFDYGFTELAMKIKLFHIDSKLAKHVKVN